MHIYHLAYSISKSHPKAISYQMQRHPDNLKIYRVDTSFQMYVCRYSPRMQVHIIDTM